MLIGADVEVSGNSLASIVDGFGVFRSLAIKHLRAHGLYLPSTDTDDKEPAIDTTRWYSMRSCLDAFAEILKHVGPNVMFDIGLLVPKNAKFPLSIKDVDAAIQAIDVAYHMNHRKGGKVMFNPRTGQKLEGIGHYGYRRVPDQDLIVSECDNPYPCPLDMGILTAVAKKFAPRALVTHDEAGPCRTRRGSRCVYLITW